MSEIFSTICRNCNKLSIEDHFGFCNQYCLIEYSYKYNYTIQELKETYSGRAEIERKDEEIEFLKLECENLKSDYDNYCQDTKDMEEVLYSKEEDIDELNNEINELKDDIKNKDELIEKLSKELEEYHFVFLSLKKDRSKFNLIDI